MEFVNREDVTRVYFGKDGECCCGCSGNFHSPDKKAMVTKAVNRINEAIRMSENGVLAKNVEILNDPGCFTSAGDGNRLTIVYFDDRP